MSILPAFARRGYLRTPPSPPGPDPGEPSEPTPPWLIHPAAPETQGDVKAIEHMKIIGDTLFITTSSPWDGGDSPLGWVDLTTGDPSVGPIQPSEGFPVIRQLSSGRIVYPWVDPTGAWGDPQGYTYSDNGTAGPWEHQLIFPAYHILDFQEHAGALWACGAGPLDGVQTAQVWKSEDGGDTWARSLTVTGDTLVRIYSLIVADGDLWVLPSGTTMQKSLPHRLEGENWEPHSIPNDTGRLPFDSFHYPAAVVSAGGVAYGRFGALDGQRFVGYSGTGEQAVRPSWADAAHVYAVPEASTTIVRAPLLTPGSPGVVEWEHWLSLDENMPPGSAKSAALHDGYVYVGGTQGRIWRFPAP